MKLRDYAFFAMLALAVLIGQRWVNAHPQPTLLERFGRWAAIALLLGDQTEPQLSQSTPHDVVNAPAERVIGPDGHPLIDHAAGW